MEPKTQERERERQSPFSRVRCARDFVCKCSTACDSIGFFNMQMEWHSSHFAIKSKPSIQHSERIIFLVLYLNVELR